MKHYEPLHEGFTRFCSSRCYGVMDTDDLVQEAIMVAFENFDSIREKKALLAYLIYQPKHQLLSGMKIRPWKANRFSLLPILNGKTTIICRHMTWSERLLMK